MSIYRVIKEAIEESRRGIEDTTIYDDNPTNTIEDLNAIFGMVDYF